MKMSSLAGVFVWLVAVAAPTQAQAPWAPGDAAVSIQGQGWVEAQPREWPGQGPARAWVTVVDQMPSTHDLPRSGTARTRGSRPSAEIYATLANSVVLVVGGDEKPSSMGSGSLVNDQGWIVTNWHVVTGGSRSRVLDRLAVFFKPAQKDGQEDKPRAVPARLVARDEQADLALLQIPTSAIPPGVAPMPLGAIQDVVVGADVHAIGHPLGLTWTYTKGVVSQIRQGYRWNVRPSNDGPPVTHSAAYVIQTQTPINPGNSGGPLISAEGRLIGVNTFTRADAQGLNSAVSIEDVRRLLTNPRPEGTAARDPDADAARQAAEPGAASPSAAACKAVRLKRGMTSVGGKPGLLEEFDINCDGVADFRRFDPDDQTQPIWVVRIEAGKVKSVTFDDNRDGRWDRSFHYLSGGDKPDMIGVHPEGKLEPTSYRKYTG